MEQLKSRLATTNDEKYASQISGWIKESGTMLPKTVDDLMALFSNNDSVLVFDDEGALVSHAYIFGR